MLCQVYRTKFETNVQSWQGKKLYLWLEKLNQQLCWQLVLLGCIFLFLSFCSLTRHSRGICFFSFLWQNKQIRRVRYVDTQKLPWGSIHWNIYLKRKKKIDWSTPFGGRFEILTSFAKFYSWAFGLPVIGLAFTSAALLGFSCQN